MSDDSKYKEEFNKNYLPFFTEYFSQSQMEKKITSYKYLLEDIKKIEKTSTESNYKHVMTKKVLFLSKNAKNLCRGGVQYKHMRNVILKLFNIEFSPEDYSNKAKTILKGRTFAELEGICPSFSPKSFEEAIPFTYLNEKGISALKEVTWLLNGVLTKIDYCPSIIGLGSLLLLFLSKEETYEVLRTIIETDQNEMELNRLRWHFRYTILDNIQMDSNIKTCIIELSNYTQQFKQLEKMGFSLVLLIRDIFKQFFLDHVNFVGIMRILPFFLLEGIKGVYRIIYALLYFCSLNIESDQKAEKNNIPKEKKSKEELLALFKEKSNKITDFVYLMDFALKWELKHTNNNYIYQVVPSSIKKNTYDINNLIHIPSFEPESVILSKENITKLWELLPVKLRICNCTLLFKKEEKEKSEIDLGTLYENFEELEEDIKLLLIIQTDNDEIFGLLMQKNLKLEENVEYQNVTLAYLISISPELKLYLHKNKNDNIICFEPGAIRYGYGDNGPAILINYDLSEGSTEKNSVFGENICLLKDYSNDGFFNIKNLEIYLMQ